MSELLSEPGEEAFAGSAEGHLAPVPPALAGRPRGAMVCCHLGMEHDPFTHHDDPSPDHRCYLWMQRDRIDLAHQEMFCLTERSESCPWLSISTPRQRPPLHRRTARALTERAAGRPDGATPAPSGLILAALLGAAMTIGHWLIAAWRFSRPLLSRLGSWLLVALRLLGRGIAWPVIWLSRHYRAVERAALRALAALGRALWAAARAIARRVAGQARKALLRVPASAAAIAEATPAPMPVPVSPAAGTPEPTPAPDPAAASAYLRRGMEAVRDGDSEVALSSFRFATMADEGSEQAWLWRGALADSAEEKERCLRRALAINPRSARARLGLLQLGVVPEASGGVPAALGPAEPSPATESLPAGIAERGAIAEAADPSVTWRCPHCAAINPYSFNTCQRCARPSPRLERELATGDGLLKSGLEALRAGNEDLAHHYFGLAAEAGADSELAWYWRAKTAPTLEEVIHCLRRIVEMNPLNAKAQADLAWALERQRHERERMAKADAGPTAEAPAPASTTARPSASWRLWLQQVASVAAFLLALLLGLPQLATLTDLPADPLYRPYLDLLPGFTLPALPVRLSFLPAFDLGPALPVVLGLLLLHAAFGLGDGGGLNMRIWAALLGAAALPMLLLYVANPPALWAGVALAVVVVAASLAGRAGRSLPVQRSPRAPGSLRPLGAP